MVTSNRTTDKYLSKLVNQYSDEFSSVSVLSQIASTSQRRSHSASQVSFSGYQMFPLSNYYKDTCASSELHTVHSSKLLGSPVSLSIHTIRGSPAETDWSVPVHSGSSPLQPSTINTPRGRLQSPFLWLESDGDPNHTQPWQQPIKECKQPTLRTPGVWVGATKHPLSVSEGFKGDRVGAETERQWPTFSYFRVFSKLGQVCLQEEQWGCMNFSERQLMLQHL